MREWSKRYSNDRRSRGAFLWFYSAIFKLMSANLQTLAYNSRMAKPSYTKFWQQFEFNKMFVCTKFQDNQSCDFSFRTRKPFQKLGVKDALI